MGIKAKAVRNEVVLETKIETDYYDYVTNKGDECIKIRRKNWPDRLTIVNHGHCFYIEFKRPGKVPGKGQEMIHRLLRAKGHKVYVCDNYKEAVNVYKKERIYSEILHKAIDCLFTEEPLLGIISSAGSRQDNDSSSGISKPKRKRDYEENCSCGEETDYI